MTMNGRIKFLFYTIIFATITSCTESPNSNSTYFGGRIINPRGGNVVLFHKDIPIDTFKLSSENKFFGEIKNINEGLYYFRHGEEFQYLYLKPNDSILIRLNAWDFDESLVFSGKGAKRNNILIDCFLDAEKDDKLFYKYYDLNPIEFKKRADSIEKIKLNRYNNFLSKNPDESEFYNSLLKVAFMYPLYGHIENYPLVHSMKKKGADDSLPNDFYNYRSNVSITQDSMLFYNPYRDYIVNHLYNLVHSEGLAVESDEFTIELLKTIDRKLSDKWFKNNILRRTTLGHFYRKSTCNYSTEVFNTFLKTSDSEEDKKLMLLLLDDAKKLPRGKKLTNFNVYNYNHSNTPINSIIKNNIAVIYFWNSDFTSKSFTSNRVKYLSRKFPTIKFVGVKINGDGKDRLEAIDIKEQYYLTNTSKASNFLTSKLPRTLIVDKNGVLLNGYASLSSNNLYFQLKDLINK